jgi:hypothetical protein
MELARIIISAQFSEFKIFLDDFLFSLYGRYEKNARVRNGNDALTHLEYVAFGVLFDYKVVMVEEGLDITLSYWAEVIPDENYENIQIHADHVIQEIGKRFRSIGMTKAFISYSWDNDDHKNWVRELATRLRSDGIDVTLDQWHLIPGDQLPEFMERSVRESDYVLIICTHKYKERSDNRQGGVGYEGDIITAEFMARRNHRKYIPVQRQRTWKDSAPNWLAGKYYIDLSTSPYSQKQYDDLLTTLLGTREKAPPIKATIKNVSSINKSLENSKIQNPVQFEPIQITGIIADQVGTPRNDNIVGSALYKIPFRLTQQPPHEWAEMFVENWDHPPQFTPMHRPGIASVNVDTVVLDGTTIEEVKDYHRDTLVLVIQETNRQYKEFIERKQQAMEREQQQLRMHKQKIDDISKQIKFNDD